MALGPGWSPDGQHVAFMRGGGSEDRPTSVVVTTADGRVEHEYPVPGTFGGASQVRWSPDGQLLALTYQDRDITVLGIIDATKPPSAKSIREVARQLLTTRPIKSPRWGADGGLYYRDFGIRQVNLVTKFMDLRYGLLADRPDQTGSFAGNASFDIARDGSLLVGIVFPNVIGCTVRIVRPDGQVYHSYTFKDQECHGLSWNRDASKILVSTVAVSGPDVGLWVLDRDAGDPRRLHSDNRAFWDFSLSSDDHQLLFTRTPGPPNWMFGVIFGLTLPRPVSVSMPATWQTVELPAPQTVTLGGRVTDANGKPVAGLSIYTHRLVVRDGEPTLTISRPSVAAVPPTNQNGRYLLAGLPPGEYVIVASAFIARQPGVHERRAPPPTVGTDGVKVGYMTTPLSRSRTAVWTTNACAGGNGGTNKPRLSTPARPPF